MAKKAKKQTKKAPVAQVPENALPQNILLMGERVEENKNIYISQAAYKFIQKFTKNKTTDESGGMLVGTVIEEFGKTAAAFTKEKLSAATSIIIESDTATWDADSTGGRYLVWIWYKTQGASEYRNLNVELLQEGLAIASSSANNRYGATCSAAIDQAKAQKKNVYSGKPDPNFFYGAATEIDLKELRTNVANYNGNKVAVTGVITMHYNNGFYLETQDPESGLYYGMYAYYGFNFNGMHLIKVGSEVRIAGNVSEFSGSWQISGMTYSDFIPTADDVKQLSTGNEPAFVLTDAATFANGKVNVEMTDPETEEVTTKELKYAEVALGTSIEMKDLYVKSVYTTQSDNDNSNGAMTLTCSSGGKTITVRTSLLKFSYNMNHFIQ